MSKTDLPTLEQAQAIVKAHQFSEWAEKADPDSLARVAEETLREEGDDQPDAIKQLLSDALIGEQTLGGRW